KGIARATIDATVTRLGARRRQGENRILRSNERQPWYSREHHGDIEADTVVVVPDVETDHCWSFPLVCRYWANVTVEAQAELAAIVAKKNEAARYRSKCT